MTLILYTVGPDEEHLEPKQWGQGWDWVPLKDTEAAARGRDESRGWVDPRRNRLYCVTFHEHGIARAVTEEVHRHPRLVCWGNGQWRYYGTLHVGETRDDVGLRFTVEKMGGVRGVKRALEDGGVSG